MKLITDNKGFTLVETLVVIAILGAIMVPISMTINTMFKDINIVHDVSIALRQVQNAGYLITNDIKSAKTVATNVPGVFLRLQCYYWNGSTMVNNQQVDYYYSAADKTLKRSVSGGTQMLIAEYITALTITLMNPASPLDQQYWQLNVTATYPNAPADTKIFSAKQRVPVAP